MIKTILRTKTFAIAALIALSSPAIECLAQSPQNYATEHTGDIVKQANAYLEQEKYAEAKKLYERALATGDTFFTRKCLDGLALIDEYYKSQKKRAARTTTFTVSQDTVTITYPAQSYPIFVTGDKWTASCNSDADWISISLDKKKGQVLIETTDNNATEDREDVIVVKNGNGQTKTVIVRKQGAPEVLRSSAQNIFFTPQGETNVVGIEANTDWSLSDLPDWLQAAKSASDIQFTATANDKNVDRTAQVIVETPRYQQIVITIVQSAGLDSLAFSKNNLHFGPDGGDEYIHVFTDADDWRFGDFPHWCQLTKVDDKTILVHCTPNEPVDMRREASVNVTTGNQHLGINVSQDPKPIVYSIPVGGIGGRPVSFGFNVGYSLPFISASSGGSYTGSLVNYTNGSSRENASYKSAAGFKVGAVADIRLRKNLYLLTGIEYAYSKYQNDYRSDSERSILSGMPDYYFKGNVQDSYSESYSFHNLSIPILASYRFPITRTSHVRVNAGPVIDFGLSAKMKFNGTSDAEGLKAYKMDRFGFTDVPYSGVTPLPYHIQAEGDFDLYSNSVDYSIAFTEHNQTKFNKSQTFDSAPYKRVNFGLRFGVDYEYSGITFGIDYNLMLTNMADKRYWDGKRWTVFDFPGQNLMTGYKQYNNSLQIHIGYTFRY